MLRHRNLKNTGFEVKMKHVNHMSLSSKTTRGKGSRVLDCQGFEKPNSLILRSWVFRKTANMVGTWEKAVKIYWMSQSYFLEMPLKFASLRKLPNADSKLQRQTVLSCHRGCHYQTGEWQQNRTLSMELPHKLHTDLQTPQVRTMACIWKNLQGPQ